MPKTKLPLTITPSSCSRRIAAPVVTADVLELSLLREVGRVDGLKVHEEATQSRPHRFLQQRGLFEHRLHRSGRLPEPSHALHPVEEGGGKRRAAEQVIIEKVQMPAGQSADLRQRGLDRLHIE